MEMKRIICFLCFGCLQFYRVTSQPVTATLQASPQQPFYTTSQNVTLSCAGLSVNTGVYRFYLSNTLVSVQQDLSYILSGTGVGVSGNYSCSFALYGVESQRSNNVYINIVDAPVVTLISQTSSPITVGSSLSLLCSSSYQVNGIVYTWYLNNNAISGATSQMYNKTSLLSTDAGAYKCSFSSGVFRSLESSNFIVAYSVPPKPTLTVLGDSKQGSILTLQCTAAQPTSYDLQTCKLYKDGTVTSERSVNSLTVNFTEVSLTRTTGSYTCSFTNKVGESLKSATAPVSITNLIPLVPTYANVAAASRFIPTKVQCTTPYDTTQISYCSLFLDQKLYAQDVDCSFFLPHGISGHYNCSTTTMSSTSNISNYIPLTFLDPSVEPTSPAPPVQNQNYRLQCVDARNVTLISWYKNYDSSNVIAVTSTLDVNITSTEGKNVYQCILNWYGYNISSLYYTVFSSVPTTPTLQITEDSAILRDKNVSHLSCSSKESGKTFTLYRDGIKVFEKPGNGTVVFIIKIGKNGAFYTCTTSNGFGESKHSNSTYLLGLNQLYITASSPLQSLGQPVNLNCLMKNPPSAVAPTYTWNIYRVNGSSQTLNSQALTIPTLSQDDYGMYSCQITLNGQIIRADNYYLITFAVPPAPDITVSVATTSPTATVQCFIQSLFIDVKKTFKNGVQVRDITYSDVLNFDKVFNFWRYYSIDTSLPPSEGNYSCKAQNFIGESSASKSVFVSANSGFTKPSVAPSVPQPSLSSSVTLNCSYNGTTGADLQITWQKDFVPIMETGPTLTLNSLGIEDDGFYTCTFEFTNSQGIKLKLTSDAYYLPIRQPLQPSLLFDPSYLDFTRDDYDIGDGPMFYQFGEGEIVHVVCFSQVPHISDSLWKTSRIKPQYRYILYNGNNDQVAQNTDGVFAVSSLPVGNHSFTCRAQSASLSEISYPLMINVTSRPTISKSLIDSTTIILQCNTSRASKGIDIRWKKNGVLLKETSLNLKLYNFSAADEGKYSCRQQMGPLYLASSQNFNVSYGTKPVSPDIVADDLSERGSPGVIDCITNSTTSYRAVFSKNGLPFYVTSDIFLDDGGQAVFRYTIPSISANDSGRYTCTVQNGQGVSDDSSSLDAVYVGQCSNSPCQQVCQENSLGTSYSCGCQPGYSLKNDQLTCQSCDDSHFGNNCESVCSCVTQNSKCDKTNGSCLCNAGWQGPTCANDTDECSSGQHNCTGAFSCINTVGSFQCNCSTGYTSSGISCQACDDSHFGNNCDSMCSCVTQNSKCDKTNGSCLCNAGWQGPTCAIDTDECSSGQHNCTGAYSCINTVGSFQCNCSSGYTRLGTSCQACDDSHYGNNCESMCSCVTQNSKCDKTNGSCLCNAGWQGPTCAIDTDECSSGQHNCTGAYSCINTVGSFQCNCSSGYTRLGTSCQACDDSHYGNNCESMCSCVTQNSKCDKTNGSCLCNAGWQGPTCAIDTDECSSGQHNCTGAYSCINTVGSFQCNCSSGYTRLGTSCQACDDSHYGNNCESMCSCITQNSKCDKTNGSCLCNAGWQGPTCAIDTNECSSGQHNCTGAYSCINTLGSFQCNCSTGYTSLGTSCQACDDSHFGNNCESVCTCVTQNSKCDKTNGSCLCNDGWQGPTCAIDTDECSSGQHNCIWASSCINTVGSFQCNCPTGYASLGTSCQALEVLYIRSFDIHYPSVSPSSNVLTPYTFENNLTSKEIYTTVKGQMKQRARGLLDLEVKNLRQGSLIGLIVVFLNKSADTNLGGYLTLALTRMNMSELTINGIRQPDAYIMVGTFRVYYNTSQCQLRALIDACLNGEMCLEDNEGVSFCQTQAYAAMVFGENVYDYLGLGIGVGVIAGIALSITIGVIVCNYNSKSHKLKKKQDSSMQKSVSPQTSKPTSPHNSTDSDEDLYQPEGHYHFIKRANLRVSDYLSVQ